MVSFTEAEIRESLRNRYLGRPVQLLAPLVRSRKGHYRDLFEQMHKKGFTKVRIDGRVQQLQPKMQVERYKIHDIELVVDTLKVEDKQEKRLRESIKTALQQGNGTMLVLPEGESQPVFFSRKLMCPDSGIAYDEPQPNTFSFNTPYGWCPSCKGKGVSYKFSREQLVPDPRLSIKKGGIAPLGEQIDPWLHSVIKAIAKRHDFRLTTPIKNIPQQAWEELLYGIEEEISVRYHQREYNTHFEGLVAYFEQVMIRGHKKQLKEQLEAMAALQTCPDCQGYRLRSQAYHFLVDGKHIGQLAQMQLERLAEWMEGLEERLTERQNAIAHEILKEIRERLGFLLDVGLRYLSLDRPAYSLSGGEAQRIRLATQIGAQLVNVLYILDEPSIGLHQRDNARLISSLQRLRDVGNTVIVVEHDRDMMEAADHILDLGPGAGAHGGYIVAQGSPEEVRQQDSLTSDYLADRKQIALPAERRAGNGQALVLRGAEGHNLRSVDLKLPLGQLICVTGVSGSGKSSLIIGTLYPILRRRFYGAYGKPLPYREIEGIDQLDKVIQIDQAPIGRTPRSNPATYTGLFTHIRNLFAELPEAKIRGYKPGRFSFNVKGGRCEECGGAGVKVIEMNFLPDVHITCPACQGKRYNRETLEVRYKGKSISDVLAMSASEALQFYQNVPQIRRKLQAIVDVGLGYVKIGQPSTTLSGGEAQRVKLATELSKRDTGRTLYILDEPTTGLHFEDIRILMEVLQQLVDKGNTVLIIEHNMDVIKLADHVVDIGPDGGEEGGRVVVAGTPEEVAAHETSLTGRFLRGELERSLQSSQV
jgi:excinuclease ABC subunit A